MKIRILTLLALAFPFTIQGQDPHFSQFNMAPLYLNPAQSGFFDGSCRISLNYRNQWNSITTPFRTFLGGVDLPVIRKRPGKDFFGAGLYFLRDKAGDGGYGITAAAISGAWFRSLSYKNEHYLGIGISMAPVENSIDFNKLRFPDQYDGTQYNPGITHGEYYGREWTYYFDLSLGLLWSLQQPDGKKYALGFTVFHVNQPDHSLLKNYTIPLSIRYQLQGNLTWPLENDWVLQPAFYYQNQDRHPEFIIGSMIRYEKWATPITETVLYGGIATRYKDAVILTAGFEFEDLNIGISYDINYSSLKKASYLKGGMEIGIQYIFNKPQGSLKRDVTCPIF
ncbi:MAG: PorP/SprF family type IX secretion system membrane protein [Bacteroidales bacterium]